MASSRKVAYYYDDEVANHSYGPGHPMKPYRMRLANELISAYGMMPKLDTFKPTRLSKEELVKFHCDDFIDFLAEVKPMHQQLLTDYHQYATGGGSEESHNDMDPMGIHFDQEKINEAKMWQEKFKLYSVDNDCPIFDNIYTYCEIYSGGSVGGALKLNRGAADIAINWSGGLHHAKKAEVSGFCYVNDIVLAILELLRYHERVLYIDIDVHHGDGVEEAFYTTDRVMTVSFHRYGDGFFPCTGAHTDVGEGKGKNYAINFPLADGIDDISYEMIFKNIISGVMANYKPTAIVLQCGADSLTGDKLGPFNLTLKGHGACVAYCKSLGVPLMLLGGGGYTVKNVSRCWAYETSLALDVSLPDELPFNHYIKYWGPDYKLHIQPMPERVNMNSRGELQQMEAKLLQQLKEIGGPPSVHYATPAPRDSLVHGWREEAERASQESHSMDTSSDGALNGRQHQAEFFANNQDQDGSTISDMGIVRPKPEGSIQARNNQATTAPMEQ